MKNSMKYVAISLVMIFAVLFFTMTRANASGINLTPTTGNNANTNSASTNTGTTNTNTAGKPVNSPEAKENIVTVNQINDADKDLPQTGETDVYIVAGIAVIAIGVGAFAFIKSRKYNV